MKNTGYLLKYFHTNRSVIIDLSLILLLGLTPLLWFKSGLLIAGHDFGIPLDPRDAFISHAYAWSSRTFAGHDNSASLPYLFPYYAFWTFFKCVHLPLLTVEKLWFIFVFTLPGLSMYYLVYVAVMAKKHHIGALISAIFYMFNLYVVMRWHDGQSILLLPYGIAPMILGLFMKGLNEKKKLRYVVLIGIASLFTSAANPPMVIGTVVIPLVLYLAYFLFLNRRKVLLSISFTIFSFTSSLFLSFWWFIPLTSNVFHYSAQSNAPAYGIEWPNLVLSHGGFLGVFRLLGYWVWYATWPGAEPFYSFAHHYTSNLFLIVLVFLIPILAFGSLLFKPKEKQILYFAFLCIFGLFLAKGIQSPLGEIYRWLFLSFPGFWIFRSPQIKFAPLIVLGYAVLISITFSEIHSWSKKKKLWYRIFSKVSMIAVIPCILMLSWPLVTGIVIDKQRGWVPSYHVKIPNYYYSGADWINKQDDDFKIFLLPGGGYPVYVWGYEGSDIIPSLFHKPEITEMKGTSSLIHTSKLVGHIYDVAHDGNSENIGKILRLMNVKYILHRNDVNWKFSTGADPPQHIRSILSLQKGVHLERQFGKLDFYKISDEYFIPHIYVFP